MTDTDEWASPMLAGIVCEDATPAMDPKVRDMWCNALLSEQYKQGKRYLRYTVDAEVHYDALGVLTEVAVLAEVTSWQGYPGVEPTHFFTPGGGVGRLAIRVSEWAGMTGMHPSQIVPLEWAGSLHPIWRLTDIYSIPFEHIAEMLHTQY